MRVEWKSLGGGGPNPLHQPKACVDPFLGGGGVEEEMSMSESVTPAQGVCGSLSGGG